MALAMASRFRYWLKELARIEKLLDQGLDVEAQEIEEMVSESDNLCLAATAGHWNVIKLLLERGVDVNTQSEIYGNALQAVATSGDLKIVKLLLERGAHVNAQGGVYGNVLQAAAQSGDLKIVKLLLERGAHVNAQGGRYGNALQVAATGGHLRVVELLLNYGAHSNIQDDSGLTPLHTAVVKGDVPMVKLLLERGASPDLKDLGGNTPLQLAIRNQNRENVLLLYPKTTADLSSITASDLRRCSGITSHCHLEMISSDSTQVAFKDDSLFEELDRMSYPLCFDNTRFSAQDKHFMDRHFDAKQML